LLFLDDSNRARCERFFSSNIDLSGNYQSTKNQKKEEEKNKKKIKNPCGTLYARLYLTQKKNYEESNENETVFDETWFIKIGTCDYSRRGKRANELDKQYGKRTKCLSGIEINHLNNIDNLNMEWAVKKFWTDHEDYSPMVKNGQNTDKAIIYEYKHWIDFKNKLNKLDYLYHNDEERDHKKWYEALIEIN